jgi:hypothetical protein
MQMSEHYWIAGSRGDDIWSDATYSGFRRFQVETSESLKPPQ